MKQTQLMCAPIEQILKVDSPQLARELWFISCVHSAGALLAAPGSEPPKKQLFWRDSGGLGRSEIEPIAARLGVELFWLNVKHEKKIENAEEFSAPSDLRGSSVVGDIETKLIHFNTYDADHYSNIPFHSVPERATPPEVVGAPMLTLEGEKGGQRKLKQLEFAAHFIARLYANVPLPEVPSSEDAVAVRAEKLERLLLHVMKICLGAVTSARNYAIGGG